jgi:hypothetical protein
MTAIDLLHYVFPWEEATGIERLEIDALDESEDA